MPPNKSMSPSRHLPGMRRHMCFRQITPVIALERALGTVSDTAPLRVRGGGTVPVTSLLKNALGVETITLGASMSNDRAHAPNERYDLHNFKRIQEAFCLLFEELLQQK